MIPSKLNPLGIDRNYPMMEFTDVGGGIWEVEGLSSQVEYHPPTILFRLLVTTQKEYIKLMPYIRLYDDLRGIGTVRDKITVNVSTKEKLLTKKIGGNKIFTGEDTFSYRSDIGSSDGFSRFYIGIPNRLAGNDKIIASHFKTIPSHTVLDNGLRNISDWVEFQINNSIIGAIVTDDTNTLINKFKAWLAVQYNVGTPLISQYQLATPINQPL